MLSDKQYYHDQILKLEMFLDELTNNALEHGIHHTAYDYLQDLLKERIEELREEMNKC